MATPAVETVEIPRKLSDEKLDELCNRRKALFEELDEIKAKLTAQVEHHGFTPAGAEKSRRLQTEAWTVTLSEREKTEIRDSAVKLLEKKAPLVVFAQLFRVVPKYKLAKAAWQVMAAETLPEGAPPNLRRMFAQAVVRIPQNPSLTVKAIGEPDADEREEE